MTRPPSTAEHVVFPSTEANRKGLKRLGVTNMAQHTFQSSKSKLGDSDASARENTKGAELLRSKHGFELPSSFLLNTCFNTLSMLLEENLLRRRNIPLDEVDGIPGYAEKVVEAVVDGDHGGEEGIDSGADDDVEEISDLSVGITGLGMDLILEVDEGGAGCFAMIPKMTQNPMDMLPIRSDTIQLKFRSKKFGSIG